MYTKIGAITPFQAKLVIGSKVNNKNAKRLAEVAPRFEEATKNIQNVTLYYKYGEPKFPGSLMCAVVPGTSKATRDEMFKKYSEQFSGDYLTIDNSAKNGIDATSVFAETDNDRFFDKLMASFNHMLQEKGIQ